MQRVWISLQFKGIGYQYIEIDPYNKPEALVAINPRGLVPALRHGDWGCYESTVLMEYVNFLLIVDYQIAKRIIAGRSEYWSSAVSARRSKITSSLPTVGRSRKPALRLICIARQLILIARKVTRKVIPAFYAYLQAQEVPKQVENATKLQNEIFTLIGAAHPSGPYFLGTEMSYVDVQFAPWVIRMRKVLTPYRGWPQPEAGSRWASWVDAIENNPHVKATTSTDDLYIDSYERYAG